MKAAILVALTVLPLALSGCTGQGADQISPEPYKGPKAELWYNDVPADGSSDAGVDCNEATHLYVEYHAGDELEGDFTVNVYSESSIPRTDDDGNPEYSGIPIFDMTFSGADNATFEEDLNGSSGTWLLEVHRSKFHDGQFITRLTCRDEV